MARTKKSDPVLTGAYVQGEMFKNKMSLPNQHDVDAQLFSDIGKSVGEKPRGARALLAGIAKGAEYGAKSKSTAKRQEEAGKYEKVMDYLSEVNAAAVERLQSHEKREMELEKIKPYAIGGLEISYSGMPYEQGNERMRNLVDQVKVNNPDIKGSYIGYIPNTPLVNMRDESGKDFVLSLSSLAGEDEVKRIQGNYIDQQKANSSLISANASMQRAETAEEYAPINAEIKQSRIDETRRRNDQTAIKADTGLVKTLGKQVDASKDFLKRAPELREIASKHPDVFQSAIDAIWRENKEPGFVNNMVKSIQNTWNKDKVTAFTVLVKDINKMTLDVTNGIAQPNMFIEKIGSKAVPNLDMNAEGFIKALDTMVKEKTTTLENSLKRMEILEQQEGKPLSNQYRESTQGVLGSEDDDWSDIGQLVQ